MQLTQLEAFVRVARAASFSRAAIALDLTQSSVSSRVAALEADVGEALFSRRGNRVDLTPAGKTLLPLAERILLLEAEARERARSAGRLSRIVDALRIGANTASASSIVPPLLQQFLRLRPEIPVVVEVDRTAVLMAMLMEGAIQLAFVNPDLAHSQTQILWSHSGDTTLVAGAQHPLAAQEVRASDLAREPFVAFTLGPAVQAMQRLCSIAGSEPRIMTETNSTVLTRALVEAGAGVAFLPSEAVADDLAHGYLVELRVVDFEPPPWEIVLVKWRGKQPPSSAQAFLEMLRSPNARTQFGRRRREPVP